MEVWLVHDSSMNNIIGIYSSRDKAIEASSRYVEYHSSTGDQSAVNVEMKVFVIDQ